MNLLIRRLVAHVIDSLIVTIPFSALFFSLNLSRFLLNLLPFINLPGRGFWVFQANSVVLLMAYELIAFYLFKTTVGKSLMRIRLVSVDPVPSRFRLLGRTVLKALVSQSDLWFLGLISLYLAWTSQGRSSLYDQLMRTEIRHVD